MKRLNTFRTEKQPDKAQSKLMDKMDAIACGVRARLEESTGYSKKVTDETTHIARSLGISNTEIESWANHRLNRIARQTERLSAIRSLLDKTYGKRLTTATRRVHS